MKDGITEIVDLDSSAQKFKLYSFSNLAVGSNFISIKDFVPSFCFISTMNAQGGNGGLSTTPVYTVIINDGQEHVWCRNFGTSHYARLYDNGISLRVVDTTNSISLPVIIIAFKE